MADFEEKVTITVAGGDSLARAGAEAEGAAKGVGKLKDELAELGGASAGADAAGASMGHIRDDALEAAAAVEALKRAEAGAGSGGSGGGGLSRDLIAAGAAAKSIDRDLSRIGGSSGGSSGLGRVSRDAGDAERGLRDVEGAAGDAERALGGGGSAAGGAAGLGGAVEGLTGGFGKLQALAMPALIYGVASAAATVGPALLATGAGVGAWAAFAAPAILKVKDGLTSATAAQAAYQSAQALYKTDPTTAHAKSEKAALDKLNATYAAMPAGVAKGVSAVQSLEHAFSQAGKPIQAQALKDIPKVASDVKGLIPALSGLASVGGGAVSGLLKDAGKFEKSKGFSGFVSNLKSEVPGALGPLKQLGGALGSVMTELFSKKNTGAGDSLISSTAGLVKAFGPGVVGQLTQGAKILTGINHTLTDWSKPGQALNNFGKHWDQTVSIGESALNNGRKHTNQLMSWNRTAGKGIADFFDPHFSSHGVSWDYSNLRTPVPTRNVSAQQMQGARALQQGGRAGGYGQVPAENVTARQQQGAKALEKLPPVTEKVKVDTSGAKSELAALSHYKMHDAKIKVAVSGADTAKTAFTGIATAAQQAGTKAGAAIGTGIQSGQGKATSAATAVAGGVKGAVAPLPGALQSTGAAAGAGMAAGISSETGAVTAAASALAAAAESAAKVHLQISSPSKKFKVIGQQTAEGYILGLQGGQAQVDAATKALLGKLPFKDAQITSTVKKLRKEIDDAASAGKINPLQKMGLTQLLDQDNARLMNLANKRQNLINKINAAESLAKSVQQAAAQGADLGTIAGSTIQGQQDASAASGAGNIADVPTGPADLKSGLQDQLSQIQKFNSQLKTLKKEGLDKAGIKELANDGVQAGGEAATQILAGGKKGVQAIAQLDNSIGLASKKLGITAGNAAYESGSQIGGGLAAGLKSQLKAVNQQMEALDKGLMTAIMMGLGDSPKQIAAAMAKLDKELGLSGGTAGGGSGKVTAPHKIYVPKTNQGRFAQPGPIGGTPPHVVTPAFAGAGSQGGGPIVVNLTSTLVVSGKALAKATQTKTLQRAASNISSGLVLPGRTS